MDKNVLEFIQGQFLFELGGMNCTYVDRYAPISTALYIYKPKTLLLPYMNKIQFPASLLQVDTCSAPEPLFLSCSLSRNELVTSCSSDWLLDRVEVEFGAEAASKSLSSLTDTVSLFELDSIGCK